MFFLRFELEGLVRELFTMQVVARLASLLECSGGFCRSVKIVSLRRLHNITSRADVRFSCFGRVAHFICLEDALRLCKERLEFFGIFRDIRCRLRMLWVRPRCNSVPRPCR